jgi:hypothetical protein
LFLGEIAVVLPTVEEKIMLKQFWKILRCISLAVALASTLVCNLDASESTSEVKRFTFNGAIQGSANSNAQVNRLKPASVSGRKFGIDVRLPFYFVNSNVSTDPNLNGFRSGLGNASSP